jgi:iron complex transport system ATP-binding protein
MNLNTNNVIWSVDTNKILNEISISVAEKEFVGLIGPNGSGKSSLLRTMYRVLKPDAGTIHLDGTDVWQSTAKEIARQMAVVMQERSGDFEFTVKDIVMMGRNPHKGLFDRDTAYDYQITEDSLARVGLAEYDQRSFLTLSGGEKQRVLIARALVQQAKILLLDEPTNHLDIYYQLEILELVKNLEVTTIAALHDLNLAAMYCDRLYVLKNGQVIASGSPATVLNPELIQQIYGVNSEVNIHPTTGKPVITYFPDRVKAQVKQG